ncbi:hypothetical protein U1Q18_040870 [Sarracenia purpurea var. burkii]
MAILWRSMAKKKTVLQQMGSSEIPSELSRGPFFCVRRLVILFVSHVGPVSGVAEGVNAFRPMMHNDMMVGAFSHSTAVGKLRKDLLDVPKNARINFPRYNLDEAATVCHYYLREFPE